MESMPVDAYDPSEVSSTESSPEEVEFTREELNAFLKRYGGDGLTEVIAQAVCPEYAGFTYMELRMFLLGNTGHDLTEAEWNEVVEDQDADAEAEGTDDDEDDDDEDDEDDEAESEGEIIDINQRRVIHYIEDIIGAPISQETRFDILIGRHQDFVTSTGIRVELKFANVRVSEIKEAAVKIQKIWRTYKENKSIAADAMTLVRFMKSN